MTWWLLHMGKDHPNGTSNVPVNENPQLLWSTHGLLTRFHNQPGDLDMMFLFMFSGVILTYK